MAKKVLTVYIGRFQPLHNGHVHVLTQALASSDIVLVLVGSSFQARTIKNPFTFVERADMIGDWKATTSFETKLVVLPLQDQPYNNAKWIQSVQEKVDLVLLENKLRDEDVEVRLTGADRDASTWYLSAFPQYKTALVEPLALCATDLRDHLFTHGVIETVGGIPASTRKFLIKFAWSSTCDLLRDEYTFIQKYKHAWSVAPYEPTFLTVDAVVIQSGHVLVVERGALPGKGLWALPGGFLNPKERLEDACIRELIEETGIKVPAPVLKGSVKEKEIFDDPNRSLRGRTVTTAFLIRLDDTKPLPKVKGQNVPLHETNGTPVVETAKAFWLPISDARSNSSGWFEDHHAILDTMLGMIKD